jgi:hypothetical protein
MEVFFYGILSATIQYPMKIIIEYTAGVNTYQMLTNDGDFERECDGNDELRDQAKALINAGDFEEREEIAKDMLNDGYYTKEDSYLEPEGTLDLVYPDDDLPGTRERIEIANNDFEDYDELYAEQIESNDFCLIRNSYVKRAGYTLAIEIDEPFKVSNLFIEGSTLVYVNKGKEEEFEYTGDAGGWNEDMCYFRGSMGDQESSDSSESGESLYSIAHDKLEKIMAEEYAAYESEWERVNGEHDAEMMAAWKRGNIPDEGEDNWWDLKFVHNNYTVVDDDRIGWLERKKKTDTQEYKDLKDLEKRVARFEQEKQYISDKYRTLFWDASAKNPLQWDAAHHYKSCEDIEVIKSWNKSTKAAILDLQSRLDEVDTRKDKAKSDWIKNKGYESLGQRYDLDADDNILFETDVWSHVDLHACIEKYMRSVGKGDIGFTGKDSDEYTDRIQEWDNEITEIDDEFEKEKEALLKSHKL